MSLTDNKWIQKVVGVFKQGLTPKELSLSIVSAFIIGVIPVLGVSTALIGFTALKFRLNLALMVMVSYFVYPLQFLFFVPFLKLGECLFGMENSGLTIEYMKEAFSNDLIGALNSLWQANLIAFISWGLLSFPLGFLFYIILYGILRIALSKQKEV